LTAHGYQLMEIFGTYDRLQLSGEGLLSAKGCSDAARVTFYADSDQRTRVKVNLGPCAGVLVSEAHSGVDTHNEIG
jgi:hypothetical protein